MADSICILACNLNIIEKIESRQNVLYEKSLEKHNLSRERDENRRQTCSICYFEFGNNLQVIQKYCCHVFHTDCFKPWESIYETLKRSKTASV